ncbi:MAG: UvrD-helicase domain-containing protein [Chthoniobacterales bacterium]|nr:UvrD-helicase domain-containing protein [Chthoniobacterales bacterium]
MSRNFDVNKTALNPGLSVIEASAGTGKTYTLTHLVPRMLLDETVAHLSEILLVTFTNDAAGELAERVRHVLEVLHEPPAEDEHQRHPDLFELRQRHHPDRVRETIGKALLDIDQLSVSTIHSFCQRILLDESTLCGLPVMPDILPDRNEVLLNTLHDVWESHMGSDETLASLAAAKKLSLRQDEDAASLAASLGSFAANPEPSTLAEGLARLQQCRSSFTSSVRTDLNDFVSRVPEKLWSKAASLPVSRADRIASLSPEAPLAAWCEAVEWVTKLDLPKGGLIKGTSNEGRAISSAAKDLEAAKLAHDATQALDELSWTWQIHCARETTKLLEQNLKADRLLTYDGLIAQVHAALLRSPDRHILCGRLRQRFKVALVDESQDTDPKQFEIFREIFLGDGGDRSPNQHRLVLVGDPKQAIYAFRGADLNTYLDARELAPDENISTLNRTFRAPGNLVRAVNAFFLRENAFRNPAIQFTPAVSGLADRDIWLDDGKGSESRRVEVWIAPDSEAKSYSSKARRLDRISSEVASEITRLISNTAKIVDRSGESLVERKVQPGDFAVLVGRHDEAESVRTALLSRGIPCVASGGKDVMATEEASELLCILAALEEPHRRDLRFAALATRLLGRSDHDLDTLAQSEDAMLAEFSAWRATMSRHGIAAALAEIDRSQHIGVRIAATKNGERRITNVRQLTDILQAAFLEHGSRPQRLLGWFTAEIARATNGDPTTVEERQQQLERDAKAVNIVTMHAAKGLEYPLVFVPFLGMPINGWRQSCRKFAPRGASIPQIVRTSNPQPEIKLALDDSDLEDRLRLAYVAMTRAKVKLWIYAGPACGSRMDGNSVLDWMLGGDASNPGEMHAAAISTLAAAGGASDVICVRHPPPADNTHWTSDAQTDSEECRALSAPPCSNVWTMTSFSSLTREKHSKGDADTSEHAMEDALQGPSLEDNTFATAPGGLLVGSAVHDWIEKWDFAPPDEEAVRRHIAAYAFPNLPVFGRQITGMLGELREAILPHWQCPIADACSQLAASEWHFQLPLRDSISPSKLAEIFAKHGHRDYAPMLESMEQDEISGYLHGFIDRIAFWRDEWGVIDWKTNKLGTVEGCHRDPSRLMACAMAGHYLLQMHLYLVALRRFLGRQVASPPAWLVFLRGVRTGSSEGILEILPDASLLDDLDGLFRAGSP